MKTLRTDGITAVWLGRLAAAIHRRPALFIWPQALLTIICVFYIISYLQFDMSRDNLVGPNKKYHENYLAYKKEFSDQEDLIVVVESEDSEKNRQFVERLGARMEAETNLFRGVFYKGDLKIMGHKALLFVPQTNLTGLLQSVRDNSPFIAKFCQTTNLVSFFDMINTQFRTGRERTEETDAMIKAFPVLERIVTQATDSLRRPGIPPAVGVTALFNAGEEAERKSYLTYDDGRIYLVNAQTRHKSVNAKAVVRLRKLIDETRGEVTGVNVAATAGPVLEYDEMTQAKKDMSLASTVSLVICALIFIFGYQGTGRPIKATICLLVGLAYTMAYATLIIGHLNVLTITFVPMLIGLAIDFGVHLVTRYEEELRHGRTPLESLTKAMVFTGQGILTGGLTTAGAFVAMTLTNFKGIQEMGWICGGGLVICLIPMMTMLPALLMYGKQNVIDHDNAGKPDLRERIEGTWLRRPVLVVTLTLVTCALALTQWPKMRFDYNLLHMQSEGVASVEFELKLLNSSTQSVIYASVIADSIPKAVELEAKLQPLSTVSKVVSMGSRLSEDQSEKLRIIGQVKNAVADIHFQTPDPSPVNVPEFSRTMYSLSGYLGAALEAIGDRDIVLSARMASLRSVIDELRKELNAGTDQQIVARGEKLGAFQRALFNDIRETFDVLRNQDNRMRLLVDDLPPAVRERFVGKTGKHLLQVYAKGDLRERSVQKEFLDEIRHTLDPQDTNHPIITGTPVQLYEYTSLLKRSYEQAAWYALAAIAILVFIHFRSVLAVVLALLPVLIGAIWVGGLLGLFDYPFNPANIMTLSLVIGIGVTNGVHILNRFAEELEPGILAKSTGKAVIVSGLTTLAGFGSLIVAKHHGIQSLGWVMSAGVAACMIAALTFLPALLKLLIKRGWLMKRPSIDNAQSTLGRGGTEVKTSSEAKTSSA